MGFSVSPSTLRMTPSLTYTWAVHHTLMPQRRHMVFFHTPPSASTTLAVAVRESSGMSDTSSL